VAALVRVRGAARQIQAPDGAVRGEHRDADGRTKALAPQVVVDVEARSLLQLGDDDHRAVFERALGDGAAQFALRPDGQRAGLRAGEREDAEALAVLLAQGD
jgi:hypothetical protein